jgi:hypothetical protein
MGQVIVPSADPRIDTVEVRLLPSHLRHGLVLKDVRMTGHRALPAVRIGAALDGRPAYGFGEAPPLPVYRARYDDLSNTAVYLDPAGARIVHVAADGNRLRRWLYHGLHSLDCPALSPGTAAWYVLVLTLVAGGTVLSFTGIWLTVRWLRRQRGSDA